MKTVKAVFVAAIIMSAIVTVASTSMATNFQPCPVPESTFLPWPAVTIVTGEYVLITRTEPSYPPIIFKNYWACANARSMIIGTSHPGEVFSCSDNANGVLCLPMSVPKPKFLPLEVESFINK
jgi:hypothetical protein